MHNPSFTIIAALHDREEFALSAAYLNTVGLAHVADSMEVEFGPIERTALLNKLNAVLERSLKVVAGIVGVALAAGSLVKLAKMGHWLISHFMREPSATAQGMFYLAIPLALAIAWLVLFAQIGVQIVDWAWRGDFKKLFDHLQDTPGVKNKLKIIGHFVTGKSKKDLDQYAMELQRECRKHRRELAKAA